MRILFIHQNFPGQYLHLAPALAARGHQVMALSIHRNPVPGRFPLVLYKPKRGTTRGVHPWVSDIETKVIRGEAVAAVALELTRKGFVPDVVCAHAGWGEALFVKDVWPQAKLLSLFELHYRVGDGDALFDPEFTSDSPRERMRLRLKNANSLLNLDAADHGISATGFQWSTLPAVYRDKVTVLHEGIDTQKLRPDPAAGFTLADGRVLTRADEVITFVSRNLEPYRGYHVFMRALPEILRRRPRAQVLLIGGDGVSYGKAPPAGTSWKQVFLDEVKDAIDPARVHFTGHLPYDRFLQALAVSSAHVYLTYPFVLSWSMLEAMALGALVIGSRTAPVQEVIEDGVNGLLVDFFDRAQLVAAIDHALDAPDRLQALREAARRTVVERYDLHAVCLPRQVALVEALGAGGAIP